MGYVRVLAIVVGFASPALAEGESPASIEVQLIVRLATEPPEGAKLYVAGNHRAVGSWSADGLALARSDDGTWRAHLELPSGFPLEYKLTLGSWQTVEKSAQGMDIPNRKAIASEGLVLDIEIEKWGDGTVNKRETTRTGNIHLIEEFSSNVLNNSRQVIVYLPPQYLEESERRFPVLYMLDGQNLFDQATSAFGVEWQADETAESLISSGKIEPLIIVGIYTEANRTDELIDSFSKRYGAGGKAPQFAKFLIDELKTSIDKTFRTKPDRSNTGIGGSSLGGYISLWLCEKHPEVFGKCAAISPAVLWNDGTLIERWTNDGATNQLQHTKFWIDVGTQETVQEMSAMAYVKAVEQVANLLDIANVKYRFVVDEGAAHNEAAWQKRFPQALEFLFPAD